MLSPPEVLIFIVPLPRASARGRMIRKNNSLGFQPRLSAYGGDVEG